MTAIPAMTIATTTAKTGPSCDEALSSADFAMSERLYIFPI